MIKQLKQITVAGILALLTHTTASAAPIYWTDWTGADQDPGPGFKGQGNITTPTSSVSVTYTNERGVGFYQPSGGQDYYQNGRSGRDDSISPYTSSVVDNSPTGTDLIALRYAGNQTLVFTQAIANPVFAFVSLNQNGYAFLNQDFKILSIGGKNGKACGFWGCGGASKNIVTLGGGDVLYELNSNNDGGTEPHGVIQFTGAFDTLTWQSASNEYWNGFTVGVQGTAEEVFSVPAPSSLFLISLGLLALRAGRRRV